MVKEIKFALCAAAVGCAASVAFADDIVSNNFESDATGFAGDCCITNNTDFPFTYGSFGYPVEGDHIKFLRIDGDVNSAISDSPADGESTVSRTIDFLMVAEEFDEDGLPDIDGNEQFRLAFNTNSTLNLFCTPRGGTESNWVSIATGIDSGNWVRVTMNIKYKATGKPMAQLIVNGNPCWTESGYADTNKTNSAGTWYEAAISGSRISAVDFSGLGGLDDFVLKATPESPYEMPGADVITNGVESGFLIENGISAEQVDNPTPGETGYTYKQAYDAGIDPKSNTPLNLTDAAVGADSIALTVNGIKSSYTIKMSESSDMSEPLSVETNAVEGTCMAALPQVTSTKSFYYQVASVADGDVKTVNTFGLTAAVCSNRNVIISVPWIEVGSGVGEAPESDITIDKLICTNNLVAGDTIRCCTNGVYHAWEFKNGAWEGKAITVDETTFQAVSASEFKISRGEGIQFERQNTTEPLPFTLYLYGQYTVTAAPAKSVAAGAMSLLANPNPSAPYDLNELALSSNPSNDRIIKVNGGVDIFTYDSDAGKWGHPKTTVVNDGNPWGASGTTTFSTADSEVKAGEGFWYKNSGTDAKSISF